MDAAEEWVGEYRWKLGEVVVSSGFMTEAQVGQKFISYTPFDKIQSFDFRLKVWLQEPNVKDDNRVIGNTKLRAMYKHSELQVAQDRANIIPN